MNNLITTLGDVHLGRKFTTGVPRHRLGDREFSVWNQFTESLMYCSTPYHVQVGDLFDTFVVPPEVVLHAAETYKQAAKANPNTTYIVYRGNHDASRDTNKKSSFDLFFELMEATPNVWVVVSEPSVIQMADSEGGGSFAVIPWHPFRSAKEQVEMLDTEHKYLAVFGHFDDEAYGGSEFNLIPFDSLRKITDTVVTGHIHTPRTFDAGGLKVIITGSMQPYSHGEDKAGEWYVTLTVAEALANPSALYNKNVRLKVKADDEVPEIDCLSLITKLIDETDSDDSPDDTEVTIEDFDINKIFNTCLLENGVNGNVADKISAKFKELRNL